MVADFPLLTQTVPHWLPLLSHSLLRSKEVSRPRREMEPLVETPLRTSFPRRYPSGQEIYSAPGLVGKCCRDPMVAFQGWGLILLTLQTGGVLEERMLFRHEGQVEETRLCLIRVAFAHELRLENNSTPKMRCLDLQSANISWQEPTLFRYLVELLCLE